MLIVVKERTKEIMKDKGYDKKEIDTNFQINILIIASSKLKYNILVAYFSVSMKFLKYSLKTLNKLVSYTSSCLYIESIKSTNSVDVSYSRCDIISEILFHHEGVSKRLRDFTSLKNILPSHTYFFSL